MAAKREQFDDPHQLERGRLLYTYGLLESDTAGGVGLHCGSATWPADRCRAGRLAARPGMSRNAWLVNRLWTSRWTATLVRRQDFVTLIGYIGANPNALEILWNWCRLHWDSLLKDFGPEDRRLGAMVPGFARQFNDEFHLAEAEPLRNANARRLLGGRHGHSRSHSRTGEESSARLQLKALRAVLRSRGAVSRQIVSRAAEAAALTGSDEASLAGSNTVWDGVFTSLSPTDTGGVFGSLLFVLLLALGLFLCAESAQPNLHRSKQEMFVWAFVQLEKLAALELRLEASDSELEELAAAYPEKIGSAWKLQPVRLEQRRLPANTGQKQQAVEQQEQQGNRQQEQQQLASNSEAIVKPRLRARGRPGESATAQSLLTTSLVAPTAEWVATRPEEAAARQPQPHGHESLAGGCRRRCCCRSREAADAAEMADGDGGDCGSFGTDATDWGAANFPALTKTHDKLPSRGPAAGGLLRTCLGWQSLPPEQLGGPHAGLINDLPLRLGVAGRHGAAGVAGRPARVLPSLVLLGDALLNDPLRLQHVCLRVRGLQLKFLRTAHCDTRDSHRDSHLHAGDGHNTVARLCLRVAPLGHLDAGVGGGLQLGDVAATGPEDDTNQRFGNLNVPLVDSACGSGCGSRGGNSGSVVFAGPLGKMKAAAPGSPPPPPGVTNWLEKSFEAATAPAAPSFIGGGGGGTCRAESEPCGRLYEFIGEATRGGIGVEGVEISGIWQRIWERYADARMKCGNETIKQCSDLRGHQRLHVEEAVVGQGGHGAHDFIRGRLRVAALTQGGPQGISRDLRELLRRAGGILRGAQAELLRQAAPACWGRRLLRRAGAARQRVGAAGGVRAGHGPGDVRVADVRTTGRLRVLGDLRHDHCRGRPVGLRVARDGDAALRQGLVLRLLRHLHECAAGVHDLLDEGALLADDHPGCAVRHQDLQLEQCGGGRVQTAMMESTVPWMRQTRSVVPGS
uniref:ERAP1_C domain-containing protein n=2 Tax=Macrostomum lignano TaxID=282301 RepID=A0A1I8G669_9PLAT